MDPVPASSTRLEERMVEPDWAAARWRKSRRSSGGSGCLEWARAAQLIGVRDSKNPTGPLIVLTASAWT